MATAYRQSHARPHQKISSGEEDWAVEDRGQSLKIDWYATAGRETFPLQENDLALTLAVLFLAKRCWRTPLKEDSNEGNSCLVSGSDRLWLRLQPPLADDTARRCSSHYLNHAQLRD